MDAIVDPLTGGRDRLTRRDARGMADGGYEIPVSARLRAQHTETVVRVVEGDAFDQAGERFPGWGRRRRFGMPAHRKTISQTDTGVKRRRLEAYEARVPLGGRKNLSTGWAGRESTKRRCVSGQAKSSRKGTRKSANETRVSVLRGSLPTERAVAAFPRPSSSGPRRGAPLCPDFFVGDVRGHPVTS